MAAEHPRPLDCVFDRTVLERFFSRWVFLFCSVSVLIGSYRVRKIFSGYVKNFPLYVFIERADLTHTLMHQAFDRDDAMHSVTHDVFNAHTVCNTWYGLLNVRQNAHYRRLTKHHVMHECHVSE